MAQSHERMFRRKLDDLAIFQVRHIHTVSLAIRTFLLLMKNYRSVLLSYTKRTRNLLDAFPYVGVRLQTYGRLTGALGYD